MRYVVLATDYDNTLAREGRVDAIAITALRRLLQSGRKLVLVTGRRLPDLLDIFPEIGLCERVVTDNGAVLYRPATREQIVLAPSIPPEFVDELRRRQVPELSVGESIVSTIRPHELALLEVIRDMGLELHVVFNRDSVMVLPAGINKATGLMAALREMGYSIHNVVAVGDAENDHALLHQSEYAVAVANAVPTLQAMADRVTTQPNGLGVVELIDDLVNLDLYTSPARAARHAVVIGVRETGAEVTIPAIDQNLLLAGSSASGKSTFATGILERVIGQGYQCCVIDPEGDYEGFAGAIMFGTPQRGPGLLEISTALDNPDQSFIVNLVGLRLSDRPAFFLDLLSMLQERRAKFGRPHWILVDEAHHLMPRDWEPIQAMLTQNPTGMLYVTVHPDHVAKSVLDTVDVMLSLGEDAQEAMTRFSETVGRALPKMETGQTVLSQGEALFWNCRSPHPPYRLHVVACETDRRRHRRKYAEGEMPIDRSFYFRGPDNALNLRAHNLVVFMQLAEGVDEDTWLFHLRRNDYSTWMSAGIKDPQLAEAVREIERHPDISVERSRQLIRSAIEQRYTVPLTSSCPSHKIYNRASHER